MWFKAVPPAFAHEGGIARWTAAARPEHGATVLGCGDGWLLTEELADGSRAGTLPQGSPLRAAARLQLASIGRTAELTALGCPDRGPDRIVADLEALTARPDLLGAGAARELTAALPGLTTALGALAADGVPRVLVHGDIQEGNALWTGSDWALIDWTDATVSHPFAELARPLMHADRAQRAHAEAAFTSVWSEVLEPDRIAHALRLAPVLGAAHQAGNYLRIVEGIGAADGLGELLGEWVRRLLVASETAQVIAASASPSASASASTHRPEPPRPHAPLPYQTRGLA